MDGYVRVSQVAGRTGDRFHSPDAQRESIAAWAAAHGIRIGAWHEDLDQSGGTMDRPGMQEALRRVEAGLSGGVIVARLDRFARTVVGGLTTIRDLHERGARVVSVAESLDPSTPMGRALLALLLIMAEWQRDQATEYLAAAQARAISLGRFPGHTPYGYARTPAGHTIVDEQAADVVRRVFRERAAGVGWRKIAGDLTASGIPTSRGRAIWAPTTVLGIVRSEASLGVFVGPGRVRIEDAWPAIVDRELWERANRVRGSLTTGAVTADRLLAGIARCAECRMVLRRAKNPEGFISYACTTRGCQARGSIGAHLLDAHASALIDDRFASMRLQPQPTADDGEMQRLIAGRAATMLELERWRDDVQLRGVLGDNDWREGILARARARDDAEFALAERRAATGMPAAMRMPDGRAVTLGEMPWGLRRQVAAAALHSVWLRASPVRGPAARLRVAERVLVVWQDDRDRPELPSKNGAPLPPVRW